MDVNRCSLTFLSKYINQLETNIQNYAVPNLCEDIEGLVVVEGEEEIEEEESKDNLEAVHEFIPFQKCRPIDTPHICLWLFMEKNELEHYISLNSSKKMRDVLDEKFGRKLKGYGYIILIEFLLDATIFCINSNFGLEQTSAILSIYYLTHKYFTDHLYVCPEDLLRFFKDFLIYHSLLFPPSHIKLFNVEECKGILMHFFTLYLRHMPLIRLLSLPNFGFELDYLVEQPVEKKGKKSKNKTASSDKKSKKSGKKSKK